MIGLSGLRRRFAKAEPTEMQPLLVTSLQGRQVTRSFIEDPNRLGALLDRIRTGTHFPNEEPALERLLFRVKLLDLTKKLEGKPKTDPCVDLAMRIQRIVQVQLFAHMAKINEHEIAAYFRVHSEPDFDGYFKHLLDTNDAFAASFKALIEPKPDGSYSISQCRALPTLVSYRPEIKLEFMAHLATQLNQKIITPKQFCELHCAMGEMKPIEDLIRQQQLGVLEPVLGMAENHPEHADALCRALARSLQPRNLPSFWMTMITRGKHDWIKKASPEPLTSQNLVELAQAIKPTDPIVAALAEHNPPLFCVLLYSYKSRVHQATMISQVGMKSFRKILAAQLTRHARSDSSPASEFHEQSSSTFDNVLYRLVRSLDRKARFRVFDQVLQYDDGIVLANLRRATGRKIFDQWVGKRVREIDEASPEKVQTLCEALVHVYAKRLPSLISQLIHAGAERALLGLREALGGSAFSAIDCATIEGMEANPFLYACIRGKKELALRIWSEEHDGLRQLLLDPSEERALEMLEELWPRLEQTSTESFSFALDRGFIRTDLLMGTLLTEKYDLAHALYDKIPYEGTKGAFFCFPGFNHYYLPLIQLAILSKNTPSCRTLLERILSDHTLSCNWLEYRFLDIKQFGWADIPLGTRLRAALEPVARLTLKEYLQKKGEWSLIEQLQKSQTLSEEEAPSGWLKRAFTEFLGPAPESELEPEPSAVNLIN